MRQPEKKYKTMKVEMVQHFIQKLQVEVYRKSMKGVLSLQTRIQNDVAVVDNVIAR